MQIRMTGLAVLLVAFAASSDAQQLLPSSAQQTIRCESIDGRYTECRANGYGPISVARQLSSTDCVEGRTWGFRDGHIWVRNGCRAEFTVGSNLVTSGGFGRAILCESVDGRRTHCPAETRTGIQIVRQISRSSCDYGRDWGYDANGIWVNNGCRAEFAVSAPTILCESTDGRRKVCRADTRYGVELHRQVSNAECVRNKTWGYDRDGIWVTSGCRGEFALADSRTLAAAPAGAFICESEGGRRNVCRVDTRYGIRLQRQLSNASCVQNRTWGYDANGVWVTEGCRAEFVAGDGRRTVPMTSAGGIPTVVCESIDGRRNVCRVDTRYGVRVQRQLSNTDCVMNRTWGYDSAGIWVTNGCRAEFALEGLR